VQKRGCLGCSFPILVILGVIVLALTVLGLISGALFGNHGPSWLNVPSPEPALPPEAVIHVGSFAITNTMLTSWISIVLILLISFFAFRRMKLVPKGLQGVMEFGFGFILDFCVSVSGEKNGRRFFPVVATIFIFVVVNAWLSLLPIYGNAFVIHEGSKAIPLLRGANTDLNVTLALALFSFIAVEYYGVKMLGAGKYLQKFIRVTQLKSAFGQIFGGKTKSGLGALFFGFIDLVVGALETLSEFIRLISFSFRLFGNMMAGEILLMILAFLVPLTLAVPFYGLEMFIGFIQAFVFASLTLIFINLAVASHDEASSEHEASSENEASS
jgi:F-type H+-transporting ATPase subunit a